MEKLKKQLALLLLIIVFATAGIHKLLGDLPPEWFENKFNNSFLGAIPGGIVSSYWIIILLELVGALLFMISFAKAQLGKVNQRFLELGFVAGYILFVILTFGSFLVEDYGNGFKDFMYFVGLVILEKLYFKEELKRP